MMQEYFALYVLAACLLTVTIVGAAAKATGQLVGFTIGGALVAACFVSMRLIGG